jgi:type II secretory pathway pseudopilin PulG
MTSALSYTHASEARRRARASGRAGFTLIELTISLVAGLMVAMAVMGVSREATNTFHEEVRVSGAEMGLRIAMERIRLDLQRAAFMSTPNIVGDPLIARQANYGGATPWASNYLGAAVPYSLAYLSGIALRPQQATVMLDGAGLAQLSQGANNLAPDVIDIGGNFSSSDEYAASVVWNPATAGAGCSTLAAISIEMTTPAGWRIRNAETAASAAPGYVAGTALQAAFHPGGSLVSEFLIHLTDQSGRSQYLVGCNGGINVGTSYNPAGTVPTALVYLSPLSMILSTNNTGGLGGVAGFAAGWVTVSPVQVTRWDIQTPAQLAASWPVTAPSSYIYGQTATGLSDASDFLLTRSYLDFSTCGAGTPCPVDPMTTEVVAEYAVDMKFSLTIDKFINPTCLGFPCPNAQPIYATNPLVTLGVDGVVAGNPYAAQTSPVYVPSVGPQRVRDVQVRLGIRSPFGDRPAALPISGSSALSTTYLYRYLLDGSALHYTPAMPFARVRENTAEVNLSNQARYYW